MIFSRASAVAGAVFGGLAVFLIMQAVNALWVIPAAKEAGREIERAASLNKAIELLQKRSETNAEIRNLDPPALCASLGGKWVLENCE